MKVRENVVSVFLEISVSAVANLDKYTLIQSDWGIDY